jgi:hypothetical protein
MHLKIIRFIKSKLFIDLYKLYAFNILFSGFSEKSPILVWQIGKVGSSTVYVSLKNAKLGVPVIHCHFLSKSNIKEIEQYYLSVQPADLWLINRTKKISNFVYHNYKKYRWKIITLIREPVAREVSDFFQNLKRDFPDFKISLDDENVNSAMDILINRLKDFDEYTDYTNTWFDLEMNDLFDFDIYEHKFDKQRGYQIYDAKNADILAIRLENLSTCFQQAIKTFLKTAVANRFDANLGTQKDYDPLYRAVKSRIKIPRQVLNKIYTSRYTRTFYTEDEISQFTEQWVKV